MRANGHRRSRPLMSLRLLTRRHFSNEKRPLPQTEMGSYSSYAVRTSYRMQMFWSGRSHFGRWPRAANADISLLADDYSKRLADMAKLRDRATRSWPWPVTAGGSLIIPGRRSGGLRRDVSGDGQDARRGSVRLRAEIADMDNIFGRSWPLGRRSSPRKSNLLRWPFQRMAK